MRPPGYETLAHIGSGGYATRAVVDPDGIPARRDATGTGTFTTPDGVLHQHASLHPPVTACTCRQAAAARGRQAPDAGRYGAARRGGPDAATLAAQTEIAQLELMRLRTRMLELGTS